MLRSLCRAVSFRAHQLFAACFCLFRGLLVRLNPGSSKAGTKNDEMPQEMNILCCYSCSMYQVHIVKKSTKWQCKICGKKQSIQVVYFQGTGSDCRKQVQYMNGQKAKQEDEESFHSTTIPQFGLDCEAEENGDIDPCDCPTRAKRSYGKWARNLEKDESEDDDGDDVDASISTVSEEKENSQEKRRDKSYSLPPTQDFSKVQSGKWSSDCRDRTSRSRTYPLADNSRKVQGKWDKYLKADQEGSTSKFKFSQNLTVKPLASHKNGIFDDSDDDLDDVIDF